MKIAFDSPHNTKVLAYLAKDMLPDALKISMSPDDYEDGYFAWTHPELSDRFWSLASAIKTSHWVLYDQAVLIHPESGIIFGCVRGTDTLALRLPPKELEETSADPEFGRKIKYKPKALRASELGDDWAFANPFSVKNTETVERWVQAAHDYAGTLK